MGRARRPDGLDELGEHGVAFLRRSPHGVAWGSPDGESRMLVGPRRRRVMWSSRLRRLVWRARALGGEFNGAAVFLDEVGQEGSQVPYLRLAEALAELFLDGVAL